MAMQTMKSRLLDYGYTVSTGPLVWNRHKLQLVDRDGNRRFPIVWAESITSDGQFILRAEKKNHTPFFHFEPGDDWLIVRKPCILLQRTTAKEQDKRLIAAALPTALLERGVVVENHLNMIMPVTDNPLIPSDALAAFLNSKIVNDAFRTISGSVAVSAYELESLPLPSPDRLKRLIQLVKKGSSSNVIEKACEMIYTN
jgi:adenine-specific DNA-methyltransferase